MTRRDSMSPWPKNPQRQWLAQIAAGSVLCWLWAWTLSAGSAVAAEKAAAEVSIDAPSVVNLCDAAAKAPETDLYPLVAAVVQSAGRAEKLALVAFEDHQLFAYAAGEETQEAAQSNSAASQSQGPVNTSVVSPGQLPVHLGEATATHPDASQSTPQARLLRRVILLKPNSVLIDDEVQFAGSAGEVTWRLDHAGTAQPQHADKTTIIVVGQYELVCEPPVVGQEDKEARKRQAVANSAPASASGASSSVRRLRVCHVRSEGVALPAVSTAAVSQKDQTYQLTVAVGGRLYRLTLPPLSQSAGKIAVAEQDGQQVMAERHLPAGLLPRGTAGRKLLERWDSAYRSGRPGWDTGRPSSELVRAVEEQTLKPCRVVELGCGTGTNAVFLARKGFDVTAIDVAPTALRLAEQKAQQAGVRVRWLLADVLSPPRLEPFDLVYDRGCYHGVRQQDAARYVEALVKLTKPGSQVLILAGNANEQRHYGPPRVKEEELRADFSKLFEFQWLRETRFDSPDPQRGGALAWSVLLRRK